MDQQDKDTKTAVLTRYRQAVRQGSPIPLADVCSPGCCGPQSLQPREISSAVGYSDAELDTVPAESNLGLGCGNPQAIAALQPGETVLDLGSGAGFDCFLAARRVGPAGMVIGVDMTPEMVFKARENAAKSGFDNVSFRLGEIEHLPVPDGTVDVIISNCVINLSADKRMVFKDACRVLKPGGRLAVSDVVAIAPMPESMKKDLELWAGCGAGALLLDDLRGMIADAGFDRIDVDINEASKEFILRWAPGRGLENYIRAAKITAWKPGA